MLKFFMSALLRYSRVRVVGLSERIEEELHLLILVFLVNGAGQAIIAALDHLRAGSIGCSLRCSCNSSFAIRPRQS